MKHDAIVAQALRKCLALNFSHRAQGTRPFNLQLVLTRTPFDIVTL